MEKFHQLMLNRKAIAAELSTVYQLSQPCVDIHKDLVIFPPDESTGKTDSRVIFLTPHAKTLIEPRIEESGALSTVRITATPPTRSFVRSIPSLSPNPDYSWRSCNFT